MFNFCQKELAPHADMIDKLDDFPQREEFWKKLGDINTFGKYCGGSLIENRRIALRDVQLAGLVTVPMDRQHKYLVTAPMAR